MNLPPRDLGSQRWACITPGDPTFWAGSRRQTDRDGDFTYAAALVADCAGVVRLVATVYDTADGRAEKARERARERARGARRGARKGKGIKDKNKGKGKSHKAY